MKTNEDYGNEGFNAYLNGEEKYTNPYEPGSINFDDWNFGWETAKEDSQ